MIFVKNGWLKREAEAEEAGYNSSLDDEELGIADIHVKAE